MPKSSLSPLLSPCRLAHFAKAPRQFRLSGAAWLCVLINVGAAQAAINLPDGDWRVAISCEQTSYARAFAFSEQVRIIGGEFSLTHDIEDFVHKLSGSVKDDRVRVTGAGRNNTSSSDRLWSFSGRAESSREVRIKGYMNGRDVGQGFYQDCQFSMSPVDSVASAKGAAQPDTAGAGVGLTAPALAQSGGAPRPNAASTPEVAADSQPAASEPRSAPGPALQAIPAPTPASLDQAKKNAPIAPTGTAKAPSRPTVAASPLVPSKPVSEAALPTNPTAGESSRKSVTAPPKPPTNPVPSSLFKAGDFWTEKAADGPKAADEPKASAWTRILSTNTGGVGYVDRSKIRRNGQFVQVESLMDFEVPQQIGGVTGLSFKAIEEFDCVNKKVRALYHSAYSGNMATGKEVAAAEAKDNLWKEAPPRSVSGKTLEFGCQR